MHFTLEQVVNLGAGVQNRTFSFQVVWLLLGIRHILICIFASFPGPAL